jgi:putative redox protein
MHSDGTRTRRIGRLAFVITNAGHSLTTDVAGQLGGENKGMNPHHLLEAALAGCTAMTLQIYADRKGYPLEYADVRVKVVSESKEASRFERDIRLHGTLTPEQRQSLLDIANKCPIHKILLSQVTIDSKLVD